MSEPEIHTLAGAYALDALDQIDREAFARHMAQCESCAAEVASLGDAATRLAAGTTAPPPSRLRAAVLAEVARTPQVRITPERVARIRSGVAPMARVRRAGIALAAAIVAIVAMSTTLVLQQERVIQARDAEASLRADQVRLTRILAAGDAVVRTARLDDGGSVTVAFSTNLDGGVAILTDLPAPPAGRAYQLWLIRGSVATSAGVLAAGQRSASVALTAVRSADQLGVTVEPAGGSPAPTQAPFAALTLA